MTNIEEFTLLPVEIQESLLKIASQHDQDTLKQLGEGLFILEEDLDEHIDKFDNDQILERAEEICSGDRYLSYDMFEAICNDLEQITVTDINNLIDDFLAEAEKKELLINYDDFLIEPDYQLNNLADEFKMDLVMQLYNKYGWIELEEKIKHLL